jgi:Domain of unknown function (DUF5666)
MQGSQRRWIGGLALALALLVAACGGSDTSASVGSGGTGAFSTTAYSEGTVTALDSVVVNGKRYDDRLASVSDEDGPRALADLKLGMVIRINARLASDGSASADSINFDSKLRGPVSKINPIARCFFIFGQRVQINDKTRFAGLPTADINAIQVGQVLQVHGYLNPVNDNIQASLIELPATAPSTYKLSGLARNINRTDATMQIGPETFDLSAFPVERWPTEASFTRLSLLPNAPQGTRAWTVSTLSPEYSNNTPQSQADIQGVVTELISSTEFRLNNTPVDAASAVFLNGTVQVGDIITVKGTLAQGRLSATEVQLVSPPRAIELKGLVSNLNLTDYEPTFRIGDVLVYFDAQTVYETGTRANLVNGADIKVQAISVPFSQEALAKRITFIP